ncbi:MAG: 23S rRNA (adenine(2030)-N(6))-methyltransferase RlmJ [Glaciecola sp.]
MLSYQHSFHAANHADVLKHVTLMAVLNKFKQKAKPYFYLDTHAGSGQYSLANTPREGEIVDTNNKHHDQEFASDVLQALSDTPHTPSHAVLHDYATIVGPLLQQRQYLGSPLLAQAYSREYDVLHASELHPQAYESLRDACRRSNLHAHHRDGFELLKALTPPKPNRGMVLIDPAYEQAGEYNAVFEHVSASIQKWPQGVFVMWYPLLSPTRISHKSQQSEHNPKHGLSEQMISRFSEFAAQSQQFGLLDVRLAIQAPSDQVGMYGSGMLVLNPPWQLQEALAPLHQYICQHIGSNNGLSSIQTLVKSV